MRPVIGIIGNHYLINDQYPAHAAGVMNSEAVAALCDAIPLIIPTDPRYGSTDEWMGICDGFVLTGGRPNVHPEEYGETETEAHGVFDRNRDSVVLPLVRACVAHGLPILSICRGFQELNVAMGGSLYPEIRDLPGRDNHRMPPDGTLEEKFAMRHIVKLTEGGPFHRILGSTEVLTNSLHGQGIKQPGERIVIDGTAPDGTPEAIYVAGAPGFTLGVQWHPEYEAAKDPVSRPLFESFGEAARAWKAGRALRRAG
ncbi:putative glutamine amidotransferase [Cognatiyoonia koreensis]|uniref:gamma-glutamyl-gamma-aminobutyrate hydrolase n=1 Tax=Cognatiyoonia koreensis TaxID=364200 RepID=A0A1I0Q0T2_9RHOB|nr:putative glutamine amidotransferase [Cognatiyoonia koreensis]